MNVRAFKPLLWLLTLLVLVSLACSLGGGSEPAATQEVVPVETQAPVVEVETEEPEAPEVTEAVEETEAPEASGAVASLEDLESAVVNIEVEGSYQDPFEGWMINTPRGGTGFIIDPSGIAITNNHVVTGAAQLKVYISGEERPRNAKVLGVSECSDLAVIDIEGDGYPYLDWFNEDIKTGQQVYTAGYPVSGAGVDYSLTQGIVSKPDVLVDTEWASVDGAIEHTAKVNPGNSGGPLVTEEGQVVGVNYASNEIDQNYAIGRDRAMEVIEDLRAGKDIDTIGVNGVAVSGDLDGNQVTGIWVNSVKSGSPADKARIQPGDIIVELESQLLDEEVSMKDYCSVLRAHNPGDTLSVTVIRSGTLEVLEGQLNGRELAYSYTLGSEVGTDTSGGDTSSEYDAFVNTEAVNSGEIYYEDTFDSLVNNWTYDVLYGSDADIAHGTENGKYRVEIDQDNTFVYFYFEGWDFGDVRIDTRVENKGANTNWVGMFCRYTDDGWYEANILSTGEFGIFYYDPNAGSNEDPYKLIYSGGSRLINTGKSINDYSMSCHGNEITLGINGTEVKTVRIDQGNYPYLERGLLGFTVQATDITPVIVEFEDFILSVP